MSQQAIRETADGAMVAAEVRSYLIAGLRVTYCCGSSSGVNETGADIGVLFASTAMELGQAAEHYTSGLRYHDEELGEVLFSADGRFVDVPVQPQSVSEAELYLRRVVPFAAALQGAIIIHAATLSSGRVGCSFIGESGVGKSTLAEAGQSLGWQIVADDLSRLFHDAALGWCITDGTQYIPLVALFFLEPRSTDRGADEELLREPLAKTAALQLLVRHGFGELRDAAIWQPQFQTYCQLVECVPATALRFPEARERIARLLELVLSSVPDAQWPSRASTER